MALFSDRCLSRSGSRFLHGEVPNMVQPVTVNTTCLASYRVGILILACKHTAAEPRRHQECSQRAKSFFMNCLTPSPPVRRNHTDPRSRSMRTTMSKNGQQSRSPAANPSTL